MGTFAVAVDAFKGCFRNWRLWLLQFVANPLLFGLFTLWLLIPVANALHIAMNILAAVVLLIALLLLHAGTLNYFHSQDGNESAPLRNAFGAALRNLLAVVVCSLLLYLLLLLAGRSGAHSDTLPPYLRSLLPAFLRRQVGLSLIQGMFDGFLFALRWIVVPGLILPLLASAAQFGFQGLGRRGFAAWKLTVFSAAYWGLLTLAAIAGVGATQKIMGLTPDFRTSTLAWETTSLTLRAFVSYLLGLCAWMLVCSLLGHHAGKFVDAASDLSGQTAA
jgi:hypothetical protein